MELICMELGAYQELKNRLCRLSVTMADFSHHIEPATPEK